MTLPLLPHEETEAAPAPNRGGRPKAETPKVQIGFRLDADLVAAIKATGKGYNARVEQVLREALQTGGLDPAPSDLFDRPAD